ncbi:Two-component system histidine kinase DccS [hydrothermal vent metagenome]|uniref:Two-component system histidine kinase DccS n=1 Tax=hydrothermal vent metagenome TaxID=652676 RepID=A0A1W1C2T9_9ZZZZ
MYHSEKRSLYRFLAIYLLSTFTLFSLVSAIFYTYERHHILDRQREVLKLEGDKIQHQLMVLHRDFSHRLRYPYSPNYESAIFDIDKRVIFKSSSIPKEIDFDKEFLVKDGYIYYIKSVDPYYLGVRYLLIFKHIDYSAISNLQKMIFLFMACAGIFFLVIGYFLGRLFIAPMRESIEIMNSFIQDTTHELNTPISTILTNLELIETFNKCNATEEMRRIEIASKTLSRIYDDLIYLKLNHNYHRDVEPIDMSLFIEERILYFSTAMESKRLRLQREIESGVTIDMDRDDAIRLIDNLISNSIKYNRMGSFLAISLSRYELKIRDGGVGIEQNDLKQIFDRFRRANSSEGGFGIGLNIVYQLVEIYGFDIEIDSTPNVGTEVTIRW